MIWKFKYYDIESGPDWGAIEKNCDWFRDMKEVPQDEIWHAEGDVQIHTKMVCEALINLPEFIALDEQEKHMVFTGALMHDIEKRSTTTEEFKYGRTCVVAPKHADRGEYTARQVLYRDFDCPPLYKELICKIVKWHGKPLHKVDERTIINISTQVSPHWLAMISKADILGRVCDDAKEQIEKTEFFAMLAEECGCLHESRRFETDLAQYTYLSGDGYVDYVPFDDTKFEVFMTCGVAGCGKDTYITNNLKGLGVVSLDDIRKELGVKPTDKKGSGHVIQLAKERAREYMRKRENFVWNATNLTKTSRGQLIDLFISYGAKVTIVYIEVPYKTLLKQNKDREDVVPDAVIERMIDKVEPPVREEAHCIERVY